MDPQAEGLEFLDWASLEAVDRCRLHAILYGAPPEDDGGEDEEQMQQPEDEVAEEWAPEEDMPPGDDPSAQQQPAWEQQDYARYKQMGSDARQKNNALKRHMRGTRGGPPPLKDEEQFLVDLRKVKYEPLDNASDVDCYVRDYRDLYLADAISNIEATSQPSTSTAVPMPSTTIIKKRGSTSGSSSNMPLMEFSSKTSSTEEEVLLPPVKRKIKRKRLSPQQPIPLRLRERATIVALVKEEYKMKRLLLEEKRAVVAKKLALLEEKLEIEKLENEKKVMEKIEVQLRVMKFIKESGLEVPESVSSLFKF